MFGLGAGEILVILVIALIFIGPKKLPELAKNLGKTFREFQNAMKGINTNIHSPFDQTSQDSNTPQIKTSQDKTVSRSPEKQEQNINEAVQEPSAKSETTQSKKETE